MKSIKSKSTHTEQFLDKFGLKKTDLRLAMLTAITENNGPFSQADLIIALEKKMKSIDRVSIYRNLNQLKAVGIIHEVESNNYVCCLHDCDKHPHVLLYCQGCNKHSEISNHEKVKNFLQAIAEFNFFSQSMPLSMKGLCNSCSGKSVP
jgi:Fe2+ or Zn2+ uptake regulation protein